MSFYPVILTFHITFAAIWLFYFAADTLLRKRIASANSPEVKTNLVSIYLVLGNLFGITGAVGILITGIFLVSANPGYGFFQFTSNHWLATKQVIMVVLLVLVFSSVIPTAKKIRTKLSGLEEDAYNAQLKKLYGVYNIMNLLVLINFLLALSHQLF